MTPVLRQSVRRDGAWWSLCATLSAIAAITVGCSSTSERSSRDAETIQPEAFADAQAPAPEPIAAAPPRVVRVPDDGGATSATIGRAEPAGRALPASVRDQPLVVDTVVGQINGKPVFAGAFYEEAEARFKAEALQFDPREWASNVQEYTARRLYDRMRDELLLAEFRASLKPEQQAGVLAFVEDIREGFIREAQGSEQEANRRLLAQEGITLEGAVRREAERQFIIAQLREAFANRVQVSSRDVELFYRQNIDRYRPAPIARLRTVAIPNERAGQIDVIEEALIAGGPLPETLARLAREQEVTLEEGSLAQTTIFGPEALNEAVRTLQPGQWTPRVDVGSRAYFVQLVEIERREGQSLYEVQNEIEEELRTIRLQEEESRYFSRLLARSNVTELEVMVRRLVEYATERFYIQTRASDEG